MWKFLKALLARSPSGSLKQGDVDLKTQQQRLTMELQERDELIGQLREDIKRERLNQERQVSVAVQTKMEGFFETAAAPIAQLLTQVHLVEVEGASVASKDVLRLAKRLIRVCCEAGLEPSEQIGARMAFDPDFHVALGADTLVSTGSPIVIRFVALKYNGRVLRKAGVELAGE